MSENDKGNPSPLPWRIEHVNRRGIAYIHAADNAVVAIMHIDNARAIVDTVNRRGQW